MANKDILTRLLIFIFNVSLALSAGTISQLALGTVSSPQTTQCSQYTYFKVNSISPCKDLKITLTLSAGSSLASIYARKSPEPNLPIYPTADMLTWAAFGTKGSSIVELTISHWDPEFDVGLFYIGVLGTCEKSSSVAAQYTIKVVEAVDDSGDLFANANVGKNMIVKANQHTNFRFCVPYDCASVYIRADAPCLDPTACPKTYTWSDLLLSRTQRQPKVTGNAYHGWTVPIYAYPTDLSARDANGYASGSWYGSVFGWCTFNQFCINNSTCGPCGNYGNGQNVNVTLNVTRLPASQCSAVVVTLEDPATVTLTDGVAVTGSMKCDERVYFKIAVPDPCYNLEVLTYNHTGDSCCQSTDLYVGKWPSVKPSSDKMGWSNFFWGDKNLTISAFDPGFQGGYHCGSDGKSLCEYYIGFHAWCEPSATPKNFTLTYTLQVSLKRAHAIFGEPQLNQLISAPGSSNQYQFCISEPSNVMAVLQSYQDRCPSSSGYSWLEMVISPTAVKPNINQMVWRMRRNQASRNSIALTTDLPSFGTGHHFVSVIGSCDVTATTCTTNNCSCGACSTLSSNPYSLSVDWQRNLLVPTAAPIRVPSKSPSRLPSKSPVSPTIAPTVQISFLEYWRTQRLSDGELAGIIIACIIENIILILLVLGIMYCCSRKGGFYHNPNNPNGDTNQTPLVLSPISSS
eukprot:gene8714-18014_t